jgi:hypothetical protein
MFYFYLFLFPLRDMNNDDKQQNKTKKKITIYVRCRYRFMSDIFCLKFLKLFFWTGCLGDLQNIESNCFTQWTTFSNSYNVTNLHITRKNQRLTLMSNENHTENMDLNVRTYFCDVFRNDYICVYNVNNLDGWQLFESF